VTNENDTLGKFLTGSKFNVTSDNAATQ